MTPMGRPKSKHKDLPPRMIPRVYPSGKISYYYNAGNNKRIPLGSNVAQARLKWAEIENADSPAGTFRSLSEEWKKTELAKRGVYTQKQYEKYLTELLPAFGHIPLEGISTGHVQKYLNKRSAKVKANREISLLSTIFNWSRRMDLTQAANPVAGSKRNKEIGRKVYVNDEEFAEAYSRAIFWVQDAMDLLLLSSQRPGDVLSWTKHDLRAGFLEVTQAKTGKKLRIAVEGELKNVIERILARPRAVSSIYLVADAKGQRVSVDKLQKHFLKARGAMTWQIRDIRKKSGSDVDDLRTAQGLLGHASEATTAKFYRQMKGDKVKPLR
jgi:integrase